MNRTTEKLIKKCISKYDQITKEIHEILPEDMADISFSQSKAILEIDGMEFYYALGKIKETYTQLYLEKNFND